MKVIDIHSNPDYHFDLTEKYYYSTYGRENYEGCELDKTHVWYINGM
jgi:hypothetical protein